jgi:hypothetical protein
MGHVYPRTCRVRSVNGELAQVIALAAHGTSWLRRPSVPPPALDANNSTFQYVGRVDFHPIGPATADEGRSPSPVGRWLQLLREAGVDRLWLMIPEAQTMSAGGRPVDEQFLAGFANAGRWSLLAIEEGKTRLWRTKEGRTRLWHATWEVGDRSDRDKRIWLVRYEPLEVPAITVAQPDVGFAEQALRVALTNAQDFAVEQRLDSWVDWFAKAQEPELDIPYHPDMLPQGWPHAAQRCAARAAQAWVFGGMGSWNDLSFPDNEVGARYKEASRHLYGSALKAFVAATNCAL